MHMRMPRSSLLWSYEDFELVAPNVTHTLITWRLPPWSYFIPWNLAWYIAPRKFGCSAFSIRKFMENFPAAVYRHIQLLSLSRARSRAAVRPDYLSIRTTSIATDSCAMNKREEEWQAQIWSRPRQEPANGSRRISDFYRDSARGNELNSILRI